MIENDNIEASIVEAIRNRKGRDITFVDMSHIEGSAVPKFIIAQGNSTTHVAAVADSVREYLLEHDHVKPYNYDGYSTSEWIVIDYGYVLVHIFMPQTRQRYNLEELWSDAKITTIPNLD